MRLSHVLLSWTQPPRTDTLTAETQCAEPALCYLVNMCTHTYTTTHMCVHTPDITFLADFVMHK